MRRLGLLLLAIASLCPAGFAESVRVMTWNLQWFPSGSANLAEPAVEEQNTRWKKFESVSIIEGRGAAFTAKLGSGSTLVSAGNDRGLWVTNTSGVVQLLLREGDQIGGKTLRSFSLLQTIPGSPDQCRSWTIKDSAATLIYLAHFSDGSSGVFSLFRFSVSVTSARPQTLRPMGGGSVRD